MAKKKRRLFKIVVFLSVVYFIYAKGPSVIAEFFPMEYGNTIAKECANYGLDEVLVYSLIKAESGYDPMAVSKSGAIGLMQIMPETGRWIASKIAIDSYEDTMLMDPDFNIKLGCWYLDYLTKAYDGNQKLILAAYNAGKSKVDTWIARKEINIEEEFYEDIPYKETKFYLKKINTFSKVYTLLYKFIES